MSLRSFLTGTAPASGLRPNPPTAEQRADHAFSRLRGPVLEPARRLAVEAIVRPYAEEEPQEAWEALAAAGLIPETWATDPERRYEGPAGLGVAPRLDLACLLATDVAGALAAEQFALEYAARAAPWGERRRRILWRSTPILGGVEDCEGVDEALTLPESLYEALERCIEGRAVIDTATAVVSAAWDRVRNHPPRAHHYTYSDGLYEAFWGEAVRLELEVPEPWSDQPEGWIRGPYGTPFAELQNPYVPLCELAARGYVLVTDTRDLEALALAPLLPGRYGGPG